MKSRQDVGKLMEQIFHDCQATREQGQAEYAHREENALENFNAEERNLGIPRMKVWAVLAGKHWRGVRAFINGRKSQREDVRGRIKDLIVYLVLLWAMIDDDDEALTEQGNGRVSLFDPNEVLRRKNEAIMDERAFR